MVGAPYPDGITGDAWQGAHGIATTLLSEEELFEMYDYVYGTKEDTEVGMVDDMANTNDESSSAASAAVMWGATISLVVLTV
mmetsp:Transcript_31670/g.76703  ORF Transcript_31670/g.76703 Transcript_31670/m.76703 type:complete len:82 (-) Transcript_31670:53-298(-)